MTMDSDPYPGNPPAPEPMELAELDNRAVAYARAVVSDWLNPNSPHFNVSLSPDEAELAVRKLASGYQQTAEAMGAPTDYLDRLAAELE